MNCIAIDDEPLALDVIKLHLQKIPFTRLDGTFTDGFKALEYIHSHKVGLIFMDISMPDITGLQLSKMLKDGPMIIFTTAFSKYAVESYEVNAIDYLLKPIEFERFLAAVNKAFKVYNEKIHHQERKLRGDFLLIKSGNDIHKVAVEKILYIEANRNYVNFVTKDSIILARYSIQEVLKILPAEKFIRVHRGFIVSFIHVGKVENHQVNVAGKNIPFGDVYRQEFFKFLEQHQR
jgi:DNA-binding LytR/AlgR family response regulator